MKFSQRGEYLATAGQSGVILVWAIGEVAEAGSGGGAEFEDEVKESEDTVKLLARRPHRRFLDHHSQDHACDVIDLSWNRENFLLSASLDRSVRLWHVSRSECLHTFMHVDGVTSVDFHPKQDHLFVSGCFDKKLRIWNIKDCRVKEWANTPDMITAACFNPEGTNAVAGLYKGQVSERRSSKP
jgi:WD repeat-containing protein 44